MKVILYSLAFLAVTFAAFAPPAAAEDLSICEVYFTPTCRDYMLKVVGVGDKTNANLKLMYCITAKYGAEEKTVGPTRVPLGYSPDHNGFTTVVCDGWRFTPCGEVTFTGQVCLYDTALDKHYSVQNIPCVTICCPCPPCPACPGTATPGYWKKHAWPVQELTIGGVTYPMSTLLPYLSGDGNKMRTMLRALISAKLNVVNGCNCTLESGKTIQDLIDEADAWVAAYGGIEGEVAASSQAWKEGESLATLLDNFNNGMLCAPKREEVENDNNNENKEQNAKRKGPKPEKVVKKLKLKNFPNPFNPNTTISFTLPEPGHVTMKVYNILGSEVATLADRNFSAGEHAVDWNAANYASGVYFCRMRAGGRMAVQKLYLVK